MSISKKAIGTSAIGFPGTVVDPALSPASVATSGRTFLIECHPYDTVGASTIKIGFSTGAKVPHFDSYMWHPIVKEAFTSNFAIFSGDMSPTARFAPDVGKIELVTMGSFSYLDSTGASFDLRTLEWAGRRIRILYGDFTSDFEDFVTIFDGKAEDVVWTEEILTVELYDKARDLDIPIQTSSFDGDDTLGEGGENLKGDLKPLCYGIKRNIEPIQIDSSTRIYTWHNGPSAEVQGVFDRGIELENLGDIVELGLPSISNWTPIGGKYVTDLSQSLVRIGAEPDGTVTMDVRGDNSGSGYVDKLGDIIERILVDKGGVNTSDIHTGEINQFNSEVSGPCGVYLRGGTNISILLQQWVTSVNAYWYFDRLGIFRLRTLDFKQTKETIVEDVIVSAQKLQTVPPVYHSRVGYRVLGTEQDLGSLDLPSTTISHPYNLLGNNANSTQTGDFTYLDKVLLTSFDGVAPSLLSTGVWFLDPTGDVVNMRTEILFYDSDDVQVGDTQQGNFVVGADSITRSVVENVSVPSGATKITVRTIGDSGSSDVENHFAMLNEGSIALPFTPGGVQEGVVNFNTRNDRDSTAIVVPTILSDGTAIDHTLNTDGSVDISFEWAWGGDDEDIDGWYVYSRSDVGSGSYNFGTTPAEETRRLLSPGERYFFYKGVPGDLYYTFGIQAYRIVDPDVDATGIITTTVVQPSLGSEDPYQPEANIAFGGDITGTIDGVAAGTVGTAVTNFNNRNDRDGTAIVTPVVAGDGTAIDHIVNTDGSVDISFEWAWGGTDSDIDGWEVLVRSSTSASSYNFGTSADEEQIFVTTAEKRAFFYLGASSDKYYTFGIRAYRIVDPDINASEIIRSTLVQPALGAEDPYQPESNPAFAGNLTGTVNGVAAATISGVATNFNNRNDRDASAITTPTVASDGTAIDHVSNTDGSANISFEWSWAGTESDIDGFIIYTRTSTSGSSYNFGTTPSQENTVFVPADRRAFFMNGVAADENFTFGVQAYRVVDPDVAASGLITSTLVQPSLGSEDPYEPESSISFNGDVTGTVNNVAVATVQAGAQNARPTMALALNTQKNGSTNNGEATIFAVDETGAVDTGNDGFFYDLAQNKVTISREEVGSGSTGVTWATGNSGERGYFAYDSAAPFTAVGSSSGKTAFVFKDLDGDWRYDRNTSSSTAFTPSSTTLALGWCELNSSGDGALKGGLFGQVTTLEAVGDTDVGTNYITPFAATELFSDEGSDAELSTTYTTRASVTVTGTAGDEVLMLVTAVGSKTSHGGADTKIQVQVLVDGVDLGIENDLIGIDPEPGDFRIAMAFQHLRTMDDGSESYVLQMRRSATETNMRVQDPVITVFKRLR